MNVYQRLNAARTAFHALPLKKSGENTFAKYKYFELGDFLVPAMRIFNEHGLCAVVSFSTDYAEMRIVNAEKPDEAIVISSPLSSAALKGCHDVQNLGAVETYQRRYLWVAALEIVEHDALDATTGRTEPAQQTKPAAAPAAKPAAKAEKKDGPMTIERMRKGIAAGKAADVAKYLADMSEKPRAVWWDQLTEAEQEAVSIAWPEEEGASA